MRHEAGLNVRDKDGVPRRAHLEASANPATRALLDGPACPEALAYLLGWAYALHGRSGLSEVGIAPLSYGTVEAWARLMDIAVEPHEVEALMAIDAVLRHPEPAAPEADVQDEPPPAPAWPTRKTHG